MFSYLPRRRLVLAAGLSIWLLLMFTFFAPPSTSGWYRTPARLSELGPRNSTLGFGAIYAVTEDDSTWRIQGLRKAAALSGLQLTVPVQRHRSDDEIISYLAGDKQEEHFDAIRLLLNYVSLLEKFISSGLDSVLFVEDDADFSVGIKDQMESFSQAILQQFPLKSVVTDLNSIQPSMEFPYGDDAWDILWLGHYGIEFTADTKIFAYKDKHAMSWDRLVSRFNNYYEQQRIASRRSQQLIRGVAPLSTYAWAITRQHAQRLLKDFKKTRPQVIDTKLHIDCKGLAHRCMAPVPELFHHHRVTGQARIGEPGAIPAGKEDLAWWRASHKYTYNVEWSARCNAMESGDLVDGKWQCLPAEGDDHI
ncbi:Hypothetical protein R9X50_00420500 [Acrodontium crateriforme]|uniref:Glycosyltransferase family 25 n=1 Tax=Acrodontium crateriforme TaxID=150365 RepID=A0AAQ3RCI6_9PEZI|nr:Hypothetical protein R9X50_00420500 [Acrodontium crateriforme]